MNWKLFASTFALIFLAELGDKTQLAAMAKTATADNARWVVFLAASAALVLSTLIAVLIGNTLTKFVPEYAIKIAAASLFIVFGGVILHDAFAQRAEAVRKAPAPAGPLARIILRLAAGFEEAAATDYASLAAAEQNPRLTELYADLAKDEEAHLEALRNARLEHGAHMLPDVSPPETTQHLLHDVAGERSPALEHAIDHERATAAFYRELERGTGILGLRNVFATLAEQEEEHARRLSEFLPKTG